MKEDPIKSLFIFMKQLGHFKEFKDYAQYRKIKFGEEESSEDRLNTYLETLPEKERNDFKWVFGE